MMIMSIPEAVGRTRYPGRGIIVAKSGRKLFMAYFIMGRSENSRNRVFEFTDDGIRTKAFVAKLMEDPSLVIYNPVRETNQSIIITNGDQTDTIYEFLKNGKSFYEALEKRSFEPDEPNFTPRISALIDGEKITLSVIRSIDNAGERSLRSFYNYDNLVDGEGYFIHTYSDCSPMLTPFEGEPERLYFKGDFFDFYSRIWDNLDFNNRISLWVREIDTLTGKSREAIANVNTGEFTMRNKEDE
ncbi:MAG: IMP cyclohydrolase [Clostridia bacterium]|nr:IMP cyclohydrolase [Clostridia bacterium]